MLLKSAKSKYLRSVLTAVLLCVSVSVLADKHDNQINTLFSSDNNQQITVLNETRKSSPNSSVTLDFSKSTAESWDAKNQANNMVVQCINGDSITGVEYSDITIETVGNSFFSEAIIYFTDSANSDGLNLAIGTGNESSGTKVFNSNGIVDITDSGNLDVISLSDKKFLMQFYEKVDDVQDAIDARFTNGLLKIWGVNLTASDTCPFKSATTGLQNADLSVTYSLTPAAKSVAEKAAIGDMLSFDIVVTNNVGLTAIGVAIQNTISPKLDYNQFSCDDGTSVSSPASIANVSVMDIPGFGTLNCTLTATVNATGAITNSVSVTATNDPGGVNNSASITLASSAIVPINNKFALLLLIFGLLVFARKHNKI